jgi:hypothetical protein
MFLKNNGIYLEVHTALQPKRPTCDVCMSCIFLMAAGLLKIVIKNFKRSVTLTSKSQLAT